MSEVDGCIENIVENYIKSIKTVSKEEVDNIKTAIKRAKLDWQCSQSLFENVTEPDLIDYAISNLNSCEQKYSYLLRKAKELNIIL